jgi:hypothetical protein
MPMKTTRAKLESKFPSLLLPGCYVFNMFLTPLRLTKFDSELNASKAMVENVVAFFYPDDSSITARAPQLLQGLSYRSLEVILANMKQSTSLTLGILMSLYPRGDLDVVGEGFTTCCTNEEALKLVEDSTVTTDHVVDMLPIDIS